MRVSELCRPGLCSDSAVPGPHQRGRPRVERRQEDSGADSSSRRSVRWPRRGCWAEPSLGPVRARGWRARRRRTRPRRAASWTAVGIEPVKARHSGVAEREPAAADGAQRYGAGEDHN
ncbi:hypothetical protein NDU88_001558 [Pleurodeles waltl]|uniref:Uncharacterized protein n=1 Tax=Pleurodeles waltl TaxID=8319 RepID=A0AAV7VC53_PLEWA|nr:hypothetical protein NDU88_001558 [Pleurodeles waltl]